MKKIKTLGKAIIFLTIIGAPVYTRAQDSSMARHLSLQEAIDLSLKNSNLLKASKARVEEATGAYKEALDNKLPNAGASGSYLRLNNPSLTIKTKALGSSADTTGGGTPKVNQAVYGIFNVSFPIYAGGKIRYGIESAKYLEQAATLDAENDQQGVILNTINAYVNLYKAAVTVSLVANNLQQSLQQDSVLSRLEQNGLLARNDLLKAQLQSSNIELSLLDAENNQKIANINMNLMLGLSESTALVTDSATFDREIHVKNLADYEQLAFENRKDIMALSFRKRVATTAIAVAKSDLYPSVALTGGFIAADIPHLLSVANAVNIGVGIKYDVGSLWKSKSKIAQAVARESEIAANQAQLDDAVRLQVNSDYENYLLSAKKISVYNNSVEQAKENYRITKNKFDNALVNTTDLLEANVSLLQSQISLAVAKADMVLAYNKLLQTAGVIAAN